MPPEMLTKEFFADAYGWSEQQVDEASLEALTWYPRIYTARNEAIRRKQKQEAAAARHQR